MHAARRTRTGQFAPEDRRQFETHQIIEGAARQIGIDQPLVNLARVAHGIEHGILGDGIEGHALDRQPLEGALVL